MTNRTFQLADQLAFATLSGDSNPMHVDERAARRLLFGKPVVHGIHATLWCLNEWCRALDRSVALRRLRADFQRPILVGQSVEYVTRTDRQDRTEILLRSDGKTVLRLRFEWTQATPATETSDVENTLPLTTECVVREEASLEGVSGAVPLALAEGEFGSLFPRTLALLPRAHLATLLATTRIVGMECPGLHSLYSSVSLDFGLPIQSDTQAKLLLYRVDTVDARFHIAVIGVAGPGVSGSLRAFFRPPPRKQLSFEAARALVKAKDFEGRRAWIVGGSRGLGEVAAKLLAAGGAMVTITYHRGLDDAERVASEIRQGGGLAQIQELNALNPPESFESLIDEGDAPTDMLYFATPLIAASDVGKFSAELFSDYCDYYVHGFTRLVGALAPHGLRRVFFPSSVYVEDPPAQFVEYAAAKAAGEVACLALKNTYRGLAIRTPRLPKLATDQTASLTQLDAPDPARLILAAITT